MNKDVFAKQIQNLRNKRLNKAVYAKAAPQKLHSGAVKISTGISDGRHPRITQINQSVEKIVASAPQNQQKKSGGCGCSRRKK